MNAASPSTNQPVLPPSSRRSPHAQRWLLVALLGLPLPVAACKHSVAETSSHAAAGGSEAPPIAVRLAAVREVKVPRVLILSGSLAGAEQAQVAAGAAGKVLATYVERGSVVKRGAPLAKLDARMISAQAQEAEAQVESLKLQEAQAKLDCDRTQKMFDKGAISRADYDRAHTQCATAKWTRAGAEARMSQTAEALRDTQIRAPFTGMVVDRGITAGEYVRPDSRVVTLVAVDALRVELTVPEADVASIKQGMAIEFRVASSGKKNVTHTGRVRYIGPAVRQQSRDAIVEAVVDNPGHDLRPGMFVTAEVALGEQVLPAVPRSAVKVDGSQRRVFVAGGGRLEERVVQVFERSGDDVPVVSGVKAGEQVVAVLTADVRDGARTK
jgi:membrane fusion protein, multidrug efflux system